MKVIPPPGIIPLTQKTRPTCEVPLEVEVPYVVTRGSISVEPWKQKFSKFTEDFWDDENQVGNVRLTRPAHDAWGIQKIVFVFCDDYLQRIYDLPFSNDPEWKPLLEEIYSIMGIDAKKVVRCLLARMPSGVKIPVHHDTGYWVRKTHRCHVAIETGEEVQFFVGPTEDSMLEYSFDEGRIVELNNQAKHAVNNNMENKYRTHLIFDYVDEDYQLPPRILLTPDDIILQTRRSIDLKREVMQYRVEESQPRFLIIGAQKAGTTSLYEYICQHPLVVKGKRRETHYFDWRFNQTISPSNIQEHRLYYMNFFEKDLLSRHPSLITGESTPSYLFHSDLVIPRIKNYAPWAKLIIMLRNPVDRAYSQYEMIQDPNGTPEQLKNRGRSYYANKSFEEVMEAEIQELEQNGINQFSTIEDFQKKIVAKRPLDHGGHSIIARGLYCFQIEHYMDAFPQNQILFMGIRELKKENLSNALQTVFDHIGLPFEEISDTEAKNKRTYQGSLREETRVFLEKFYAPYNDRLFRFLDKKFDW